MTIAQTDSLAGGFRAPGNLPGRDLYDALLSWRLWTALGWNDIRRRYRRSILGPFWITISMSLLAAALGSLYGQIFQTDLESYLPYLTLGFIVWNFISTSLKESCQAFWGQADLIKQIRVPFALHVMRIIWTNLIVLLHTIIIIVPIWIWFRHWPSATALLALPGVAVIGLNLLWVGLVLAVLNTRFRDVSQLVETVLQIMVFATPVMWPVNALGDRTWVADFNPLYHLLELVRAPLQGQVPEALSWIVAISVAAAGCTLAALLLRRVERRIVYWL